MRRVLALASGAALLTVFAVAGAGEPARPPPPAPADANVKVHKFDHALHRDKTKLPVDACGTCHGARPDGQPTPPGADAHKPCMTSGCHLEKGTKQGGFLDKDAKLCLGCHDSSDNHRKNPAGKIFKARPRVEFYVEFDHKAHVAFTKSKDTQCTTCHQVDKTTFKAILRPQHAQCVQCHQGKNTITMAECGSCHLEGAREQVFFSAKRAEAKIDKTKFKHEHVGHRFLDKDAMTQPLECGWCHKRVEKLSKLVELKQKPIIDNETMRGSCGKSGCHADVDATGPGMCERCHEPGIQGATGTFMHVNLD